METEPDKPETQAPGGLTASPSYDAAGETGQSQRYWGHAFRVSPWRAVRWPSESTLTCLTLEGLGVEKWRGRRWTSPTESKAGRRAPSASAQQVPRGGLEGDCVRLFWCCEPWAQARDGPGVGLGTGEPCATEGGGWPEL